MKTQKGQILIITLLVLTIVAIITVSLVGLVNRDIQQVASTQKYEDAYNTAETQLKKILDVYAQPNKDISKITDDFNGGADGITCTPEILAQKKYKCTVNSKDFSTSNLYTEMYAQDTASITEFQIYKDRSFDINLSGYSFSLDLSWDKNAAIEFTYVYSDSSGAIQSVKDVYDPTHLYNSFANINDQPYNDITGIHPINFRDIPGTADETSVRINISEIVNINGGAISGTPISLRITPRMNNKYDSILLSMTPGAGSLPDQIRNFTSKSYDLNGGNNTPVANLETKVPLSPQPDNVLDYAFITNGTLKNGP